MEYFIEKIGMSRQMDVPAKAVTLLRIKDTKVCELLANKKAIVAFNHGKKTSKSIQGQQKKYNLSKEFNSFATLTVANEKTGDLNYDPLNECDRVKISFKSKGRGFSGVVRRHNFGGGRATHGSRMHRHGGSIGNCEFPGRVQKGRKMPGQYGNKTATVVNEIVSFDMSSKILVVKGSVPGFNGASGKLTIA